MIRAVCFDLDDTLCDDLGQTERCIREAAARARERLPGLSAEALTEAYTHLGNAFWNRLDLVVPPSLVEVRTTLWREAFAACGHTNCANDVLDEVVALYAELRRTGVELFPDALPTLDGLRADGYKLALVTNGVSETHAEKVVALGIKDHFDAILMPDQVGFAKPDRRVFEAACERLGVGSEETAHVGDSALMDVGGAKGAGLFAVWFNPHGRDFPSRTLTPDAQVRALSELPGVLAASR